MKRLMMISMFAGFALAGCSKSDDLVGKMQGFKDQMCACKTSDCADKVKDAEEKWEDEAHKGSKPDGDTMKKLSDLEDKMTDCYMNAQMGDTGGSGSGAA
jgi:hypothetical protein